MRFIAITAALAAGWLAASPAQALTPASQAPLAEAPAGQFEQTQYRDYRPGWGRPGWRRPGWEGPRYRQGGPRLVCRIVSRRVINERTGRVRIVRQEVCRRRW
ncbi:MAG: hypothetical protein HEQ16_15245 [Bosea sp.]|jgi:hypothetical protein|nr:hypothetical protein [Bosea sp. (in: a-proteobacteria)]